MLGVILLLTIAVLVIISIYYYRVRKGKWDAKSSSSSSDSSSICCPVPFNTGPTGCFVISERTGCDTFRLTTDENPTKCEPCLNCPRGVLTVKKPLPLDELILSVQTATGTFITDIYAMAVPTCEKKARRSDFNQTGCSVDLDVGYTHFTFDCTGGTNVQSVVLPLATGSDRRDHAFLSVIVNVADSCNAPLVVDQLSIEGTAIPHGNKCCPKPPRVSGCAQPVPRYSRIKIPSCCRNPQ